MKKLVLFAVIVSALAFTSCKKQEASTLESGHEQSEGNDSPTTQQSDNSSTQEDSNGGTQQSDAATE